MVTIVHTIEEITFEHNKEIEREILRFRDRMTRDKYLKNVTLKHYGTLVENGVVNPETFDLPKHLKTEVMFGFQNKNDTKYTKVKAGNESIEIIETVYDNTQLKLEL